MLAAVPASVCRGGVICCMPGLAVRGRRTGRVVRFPVQYAVDGDDLVVVPGHADRKSWWRNLRGEGAAVRVRLRGEDRTGWAVATGDEHTGVQIELKLD